MSRKTNGNGKEALVSELERLAEQSDDAKNWRELARSLKDYKGKPLDEREAAQLRTIQAMRNAGVVKGALALYMVASVIIEISDERIYEHSPALNAISDRMSEVKKKHGLKDDEPWPQGEGPQEYKDLQNKYESLSDEIIIATFEEFGETDLAAMYRHNKAGFDRLFEKGRQKVFERKKSTH